MRAIESKLSVNICFIVFKTVTALWKTLCDQADINLVSCVCSLVTHLMTFSVERFIIHFIFEIKICTSALCPLI